MSEREVVIGIAREITLHCHHCGTFTATQDQDNHISNITGPIDDPKTLAKTEARIPGCRREYVPLSA